MQLSEQVITLQQAKRLKELGVKQESLFSWVKGKMRYGYEGEWEIEDGDEYFLFDHVVGHKFDSELDFRITSNPISLSDLTPGEDDELWDKHDAYEKEAIQKMKDAILPAYTVAELGEMLPSIVTKNFDYFLLLHRGHNGWIAEYVSNKQGLKINEDGEINDVSYNLLNTYRRSYNLAECLGEMLIHLITNNLIEI